MLLNTDALAACFNVSSGDIEDFPGLDNLPKYDVEQESNGDIRIRGHLDVAKISKRAPKCSKGEKDETVIIVVSNVLCLIPSFVRIDPSYYLCYQNEILFIV